MVCNLKLIHSFAALGMSNFHCASASNGVGRESYVKVVENVDKKTAKVILQRPPVNGFTLELMLELTSAIKELERKNYRGFILASSSPNIFSAGLDLSELYKPEETRLRNFWKSLQDMWKTLYITPLITIAAINGHAPAGGCLLAMSCDHSIMVRTKATIGLPASKLGFPAPKWLCDMYINAIGFRKAEHALKLGTVFQAEEAFKCNLIDELVDLPEDLMPRAEAQLDKFLEIPASSMCWTKLMLRKPYVDKLISYELEEIEETVNIILNEETQQTLGTYYQGLKNRNSKSLNEE